MSSFEFPCEIVLVYTPCEKLRSSNVPIPRIYTVFTAENEAHLNEKICDTKHDIKDFHNEIHTRWQGKFGDDWKAQYRESIGHDFEKGLAATLDLQPMTHGQYEQSVKDAVLAPEVNPVKPITLDHFNYAFDVSSPQNLKAWVNLTSFTMLERLVGSITTQFFMLTVDREHFCGSRLVDLSDESTFITVDEMFKLADEVRSSKQTSESDLLSGHDDAQSSGLTQA